MSKKQDQLYQQLINQLQAQIAQANQPSPIEQQRQQDYNTRQNFLNSRDFRNTAGVVGLTQQSLPEYLTQHKQLTGTMAPQGVNQNIYNNQQKLTADQFNQDYGSAFQDQVNGLQQMQNGGALTGVNDFNSRMGLGMQGLQGAISGVINRPQGFNWLNLIGPAINAGLGLANSFGNSGPMAPTYHAPGTSNVGGSERFDGHGGWGGG